MKVNVNYRKKFTPEQVVKHNTAMDMLELVVNSREFHDKLILTQLDIGFGKLLTLEEKENLYDHIMGGAESLEPVIDHEMDLYLEMYEKNNAVVGYTSKNILTIFLNNKFFKIFNYAEIAGNTFHEWLHKMGYGHASASDRDSVPYALGYLVRSMVQDIIDLGVEYTPTDYVASVPDQSEPKYKYVTVCYRHWLFFKRCEVKRVAIVP